jgi:hypothetical protein
MSIKGKAMIAAALASTAAIVIGAPAAVSGGATSARTIHVRELFTNVTLNVDVGKKGASQGDFQAFNDPLKDLKTGKIIGHIDGTCFLVDVKQQLYNCPGVDTVFSEGTIWAQGLFSLKGAPVPPDIVHGTGEYENAEITISGKPAGASAFDWTYTITR